jgi:DNA polymerase-3 subunit epsilon
MRQIMLDTETTGLDHRTGDRVIEIACVEMLGRKLTGQRFHVYLNPERHVDPGAMAIHGLTDEFLSDKPKFSAVADEFCEFVRDAELVIHNAAFDLGFLNNELSLLGRDSLQQQCSGVIDTLRMAREMRPGRKNSLDALCSEFGVDNSGRQLHGALLDAELLGEVYLAMTRGQNSLEMDFDAPTMVAMASMATQAASSARPSLKVLRANDSELAEHQRVLAEIGKESKGKCLWSAQESAQKPVETTA